MKKNSANLIKTKQSKANQNALSKIRIIAGQFKGRKLDVCHVAGLRPTSDRMRETLFNWLIPYINNADCLDLFSGTGALGLEALSRYAKQVDCVEKNQIAFKHLEKIQTQLNVDNLHIHHQDAFEFLDKATQPYDIVFIDPPFNKNMLDKTITSLVSKRLLKEGGFVYIESEQNWDLSGVSNLFTILKEKKMGESMARLIQLNAIGDKC